MAAKELPTVEITLFIGEIAVPRKNSSAITPLMSAKIMAMFE